MSKELTLVLDSSDGLLEIKYRLLSNGNYLIVSAGLVGDLHIESSELKSLGLLEKYNRMLINHFKEI